MKPISMYLLVLIFCLISCSKQFDVESYDAYIAESFNTTIEDVAVLEEFISPETIGDTVLLNQLNEQSTLLITKINETISFLEKKQIPEHMEEYKQAALNVFMQLSSLVHYNLAFIDFGTDTSENSIEIFSLNHDKMNVKIHRSIDSFAMEREKILDLIVKE